MTTKSIIEWALKQPNWQQDALRRVALSEQLSDLDISTILSNLKHEKGLSLNGNVELVPLSEAHLQPDADIAPLSLLCSISDVKNINRLAPDQKLSFALDGITLIYGPNGSGKSGYCRILKKICRTISEDTILSDVYSTTFISHPEASIRYKIKDLESIETFTWREGKNETRDVGHLSVFDSSDTRLYVDKRNRIEYLPYEIGLLTRFGHLLTELQSKLKEEIRKVEGHIPSNPAAAYSQGTEAFELISKLSSSTSLDELPSTDKLNAAGKWTDQSTQELEKLQQTMQRNSQSLSDRCHRVQNIISDLVMELKKIADTLSQDSVIELENSVKYARRTAEITSLTANEIFKDEPLRKIDSSSWQQMFKYALEYSKLVYPDVEPPATRKGDRCVLCQQLLAKTAANRLLRFKDYVTGEAQKDSENATKNLDEKTQALKNIQIYSVQQIQQLLGEYAEMSDERKAIASAIEQFIRVAHQRQTKLLAAINSCDFSSIPELEDSVINQLIAENRILKDEWKHYQEAIMEDNNQTVQKETLANLEDRKRLSENLEVIQSFRNDLELKFRLQNCVRAVKTNAVSSQVNLLRKKLITKDLRKRIFREIDTLDLKHIPVKISDGSRHGESEFEVNLDVPRKVASCKVLSEGEQHALGLACFLADISGQPVKHGIILDDPVSSLDITRVTQVANRLVKEAATGRQVIVFTHNLLFFSEIMTIAASHSPNPIPVQTNIINKSDDLGIGLIIEDAVPWEAKSIGHRIQQIRKEVKLLENMNGNSEDYQRKIKTIYSNLRETWERLVEDVLFYKVVRRYQSEVKTERLKRVVVEDEDYKTIYWGMKQTSERSGHDMAAGKNKPLPTIRELNDAIMKLDTYRIKLENRGKKTEKNRKKFERPPRANII